MLSSNAISNIQVLSGDSVPVQVEWWTIFPIIVLFPVWLVIGYKVQYEFTAKGLDHEKVKGLRISSLRRWLKGETNYSVNKDSNEVERENLLALGDLDSSFDEVDALVDTNDDVGF